MKNENELIAEFMGFKHLPHLDDETWGKAYCKTKHDNFYISKAKYDTSWDWFMPVVEKIKLQWQNHKISDVRKDIETIRRYNRVVSMLISDTLPDVYEAVVEFIKWYNQTKSES